MSMNTLLTFKFSQGLCNGPMGMQIKSDGLILWTKDTVDLTFNYDLEISWPSTIEIHLYDKNDNDTVISSDGRIEQDKYIKLESLIVDRIPLHILSLLNILELNTGREKIQTNYWGFNGIVPIIFDDKDSMTWHLKKLKYVTHTMQNHDRTITEHYDNAGQGTIY